MIKFGLLCTAILACLIAVAHTQSDDCQVCIAAYNQVLTCTGATAISQIQYIQKEILVPCMCNQNFINGGARCPYCPSSGDSASDVVTIVSTCQKYGHSVTMPSSPDSSQNSTSTGGGLSKGAIIGIGSGSAVLGFTAAALGVYYRWLQIKKIKEQETKEQEQRAQFIQHQFM
ncbi:9407_t:CDS:2 [Ambispora gerdemannii]|uniref:9407_t:CDS:1 n=1 Tax=Ambispora gerdemannii TaxID=144530 RepID=A0A9N9H0I3_9GLOM|nr:9407_t:CDS:2 [Ambispora gerdemannii]